MELNNKEKKIKQVLSEVSYEVDTDFLWKEVSKELDDKKKKRRFFWIFPAFGLGLLALFFFNNYSIVGNTSNTIQENSISNLPTSNIQNENKQDLNNAFNNTNNNQTSQSSIAVSKNNANNNPSISNQVTNNKSSIITSNPITQKPVSIFSQNYTSNNTTRGSIFNSAKATNNIVPVQRNPILPENNLSKNKTEKTENLFTGYPNTSDFNSISNLKIVPVVVEKKKSPSFVLVEPTTATSRFYVTAGLGTIRDINTMIINDDKIPSNLFNREKSLWGMNAAIQAGIETKSRFKFFGGFDYAQLVTQYFNGDTEIVAEQISSTLESIDASNNLTTTEGSLTTTTTIDKDILWHRHHNKLNFQLGVSKDLFPKSRFVVEPEVSLLQNIISSHRGYYFSDESPNFVKFERGEESPYRKNTGLKTQLGLNLGYKTQAWQFNINTGWRNQLSNLTKETNNYQIKNSQLSIQARVNCLLNWEKN